MIVWAIYTTIITVVLFFKVRKSRKVANEAALQDAMWDMQSMKAHTKYIFLKMQEAWMSKNMYPVKDMVTAELYKDYKSQLEYMDNLGHTNMLEAIHIKDVKIISCEDFNDDAKDSFIAYIKGSIIDYTVNSEGRTVTNRDREKETFKDTYHFIRKDNKWLLNFIDNDVSISDIISARNYREA